MDKRLSSGPDQLHVAASYSETLELRLYHLAQARYAANYGDKGNLSKKDAALQRKIRKMTFQQLWDRGKELQQQDERPMPEGLLTEAVDDGPRTDKLIQAVFK